MVRTVMKVDSRQLQYDGQDRMTNPAPGSKWSLQSYAALLRWWPFSLLLRNHGHR